MMRATLVALGCALALLWLVGVVEGSTTWMTWLDGVAAVLSFWLAPRDQPIGPALIGVLLLGVFVVALATRASGWLTWFTLAFACGYFLFAGFAYLVRLNSVRERARW